MGKSIPNLTLRKVKNTIFYSDFKDFKSYFRDTLDAGLDIAAHVSFFYFLVFVNVPRNNPCFHTSSHYKK